MKVLSLDTLLSRGGGHVAVHGGRTICPGGPLVILSRGSPLGFVACSVTPLVRLSRGVTLVASDLLGASHDASGEVGGDPFGVSDERDAARCLPAVLVLRVLPSLLEVDQAIRIKALEIP